jgi:hypothetical protein
VSDLNTNQSLTHKNPALIPRSVKGPRESGMAHVYTQTLFILILKDDVNSLKRGSEILGREKSVFVTIGLTTEVVLLALRQQKPIDSTRQYDEGSQTRADSIEGLRTCCPRSQGSRVSTRCLSPSQPFSHPFSRPNPTCHRLRGLVRELLRPHLDILRCPGLYAIGQSVRGL